VPRGGPAARRGRGSRAGGGRWLVLAVRCARRAEDHQLVPRLRGPRAGLAGRAAGNRGRAGRGRGARAGPAGRRPDRWPEAGRGDRPDGRYVVIALAAEADRVTGPDAGRWRGDLATDLVLPLASGAVAAPLGEE